jgi:hypothetical protein
VIDVREIEKFTDDAVKDEKKVELPSYQEIKKALKLDVIEGVIEAANNGEVADG